MKKVILFLAAALGLASAAHAVPAKRAYFTYTQPDGTTVRAMPVGDEYQHYYVTEDGVKLLADTDGVLRYATAEANGNIVLSEMPATDLSLRSDAAKEFIARADGRRLIEVLAVRGDNKRALRTPSSVKKSPAKAAEAPQYGLGLFTSNYPRKGKVRSLVFLVEYKDVKFRTAEPREYFSRMLNKEGFSEYGGTGSARDYFLAQSHGEFQPDFDVFGPVTLANNMAYYGGNDTNGDDLRPEEMVLEAAAALSSEIDFSQYDLDNDGKVDNIYVIYAGLGEADGGSANTVWPHSYEIPNAPKYNGKQIYGYACSNEISNGVPCGIGTFCHEYSHVLGLPDLYATRSYLYCTPSLWSVMDQGNYNNDSRTPAAYSAFERNALGWMKPVIVDGPESVTLEPITSSNKAYLIPTAQDNEFFLFENRQREGWDTYLPGHGMLIWHIDFDQIIWDNNVVNDTRSHQYVDIVEANSNPSGYEDDMAGYSFPGTSKVTSFTGTTTPAFKDWKKKVIDYPITNIAESADGIITFDISGGRIELDAPLNFTADATEKGTIELSWDAVAGARSYDLSVYTLDTDGTHLPLGVYTDYNVGNVTSWTVEGVQGNTDYYVQVRAVSGNNTSDYTDALLVSVPKIDFIYRSPVATNGVLCDSNGGYVANLEWLPLEDAVAYAVTVEVEDAAGDAVDTVNFGEMSSSVISIPDGWAWSGKASDIYRSNSSGYYGSSAPSAKFAANNIELLSPVFKGDISEINFWVRGSAATAGSHLDIEGRESADGEWSTIYAVKPLNYYNNRGTNLSTKVNGNIRQIRFIYYRESGYAALDDVNVKYANRTFVADLNRYNAGNTTSYDYTLTKPSENIRYFVEAIDESGRYSKPSNMVVVNTGAGVSAPATTTSTLAVDGLTLTYSGAAGERVAVCNLAGAAIALVSADAAGNATITLPSAGFYIVSTPAGARKVYVK